MFEKVYELIERYNSIIISGHINPDGDCYGSAVALKRSLSLRYLEKKFYIIGSGLPDFFDLLMPMDDVPDDVFPESLGIIVDANDIPRMEDQRIKNCKEFVKIDHHVDTGTFTEGLSIVDDKANSTADLISLMLQERNMPIDEIVANALYLGIVTDSGHFNFVIDYPTTFDRVAYICSHGAQPKVINSILTLTDEKSLQVKGYILTHYKKTKGGVIYIIYSKDEIKKLNSTTNQLSSQINLLGYVRGYPVWASFAEYEDGKVRMELRSNGPAVQPAANKVGGGGHLYAAGATLPSLDYDMINNIIDGLDQDIAEWKRSNRKCGKKN